jgi:amidase
MQGVPVCGYVVAPMSTDLALLKHLMKCIVGSQTSLDDPFLIDLPWRVSSIGDSRPGTNARPTFAVLHCDGTVSPHPPIRRALDMVVRALQRQGYEVNSAVLYTTH